jgi:hypothetical protein
MALTTLVSVKAQAGISSSDTSKDTQLTALIPCVTAIIKRSLNRDIEAASYIEYYSGDNSPYLILRQYPVISIDSIYFDTGGYFGQVQNAFPASTLLAAGTDYVLMAGANGVGTSGMVRRIGGTWYGHYSRTVGRVANQPPIPSGNIKVTYTAGYAIVPPALSYAVNLMVMRCASWAAAGQPAQSMSYEDASMSFFSTAEGAKLLGSVEKTVGNYKSIPV